MCPWLTLELNRGTAFRAESAIRFKRRGRERHALRQRSDAQLSHKLEFVIRLIRAANKQNSATSNVCEVVLEGKREWRIDRISNPRARVFLVGAYDRQSSRVKSAICIRWYDIADGIKPNILFQTGGRVLAVRCGRTSAPSARSRYDRPKCQEIYGLRLACTKRCHLHVRRYPLHRTPLFAFLYRPPSLFVERVPLSNAALRGHANARVIGKKAER